MKIIKLSAIAAAVLATSVIAPQFTVAGDLQPGKGWDAFYARSGQPVSSDSYMGTAMGAAPGQGYDTLQAKDGAPVEAGYQGTAMESAPSQGIDTFYAGSGRY
jgi:hypothetical protein